MIKKNLQIAGAIAVTAALLAVGFAAWDRIWPGQPAGALLVADNAEVVARGKVIYTQNCASCHGADLKGEPDWRNRDADGFLPAPPHDESGHTWHHSDALLFGITKFGIAKYAGDPNYKTRMPAYEDVLSDEDIVAVLSYIKSTWSTEVRTRHDTLNQS